MALRLRIVSDHAHRLGAHASKVFGVHGGSIGRGAGNDWILPDPERYLSGKHARIQFRAGAYYILDLSSNGIFFNGLSAPLGKGNEREMKDGDYLRLGEYEFLITIDSSADFPPDEAGSEKQATAGDIGAPLDLSELLEPSASLGEHLLPAAKEREPTPWHMMTRPLTVAQAMADRSLSSSLSLTPVVRGNGPLHPDSDIDAGVAALCRGAGLDPQSLSPEARSAVLKISGRLLREVALGLLDLARSRQEFNNRFRITPRPPDQEESSNIFRAGVDEALTRLLNTTTARGNAVDAVRETFQQLKAQQASVLHAMHAAFEEFIGRLDPKDLGERFEHGAKRGVFGAQNKARYWDLYTELFATLAQRPQNEFPHLFVETFARAYETALKNLAPQRQIDTASGNRSSA